jgi:hypothetical protein
MAVVRDHLDTGERSLGGCVSGVELFPDPEQGGYTARLLDIPA